MKKAFFSLILSTLAPMGLIAAEVVCSEGELAKTVTDYSITELKVSGALDVRDFSFIAENLMSLSSLDIENTAIKAYTCSSNETFFGSRSSFDAAEIPDFAFLGMNLSAVKLPASLKAIGNAAFAGCYSLKDVEIPASVSKIGDNAFSSSGLQSVSISSGEIGDMAFADCEYLETINLDKGVTAIGDKAFAGCYSLRAANLAENSAIESIGNEAFVHTALQNFDFSRCPKIAKIGRWAFAYTRISSASLPASLEAVPEGVFFGNDYVTEISIPQSAREIGNFAYYGNPMPHGELTIPADVTYIGDNAFEHSRLAYVVAEPTTPPEMGNDVFRGVNSEGNRKPLLTNAESIDAYKNAAQWSEFIIKDISSTETVNAENSVKVFFSGSILYVCASDNIRSVVISDSAGRTCCNASVAGNSATAETRSMTDNIYIVRVTLTDGEIRTFKLLR